MPKEIKNTFNIYLPCYYVDVVYKYTEKERKMNPLEMIVLTTIMHYQQKNSDELVVDIFDNIPDTYDIHFPTEMYSNLLNELLTTRGVLKSNSTILEELKVSDISISEQTLEFYKKQCIISEEKSGKATLYQPYLTDDKLEIVNDKRKKELSSSLIQSTPGGAYYQVRLPGIGSTTIRGAYYPVDNIPELTDSKIKDTIDLEGDYNSIEIDPIENVETYTKETCSLTIRDNQLSLDIGITEWDKHLKELPTDFIQENIIDKAFEKDESFSHVEWDDIENTQNVYLATNLDRGKTWTCSNGDFDYKSDSIRFVIGDEFAYDKQYITIPLPDYHLEHLKDGVFLEDGVFFDSTTIYQNRLINVDSFEAGRTLSIPLYTEEIFDSSQFVEDLSDILIDVSYDTDESKDLVVITTLLYLMSKDSEADKVLIECLKNDDALYRDNKFFDSLPFGISDELKKKILASIDELKIFTLDTLTEQLDFIKESKNMDLIPKLFEYHSIDIDDIDDITSNDELDYYLRQNTFPEFNQAIAIDILNMDTLKELFELNILNEDTLIQALNNKELFYELLDDYNTLNKKFLQMIPSTLRDAIASFSRDISKIGNDFANLKRTYSIYKQLQDTHHNRRDWLVEYYECDELIKLSRLCDQFHDKEVHIWDTNQFLNNADTLPHILKTNSKSRIHIIPKCISNELNKLKHGEEDRNKKARKVNEILNDNNLKNVVMLDDIDKVTMRKKQNKHLSVDDTYILYLKEFTESKYGDFCSRIIPKSGDNNLVMQILAGNYSKNKEKITNKEIQSKNQNKK